MRAVQVIEVGKKVLLLGEPAVGKTSLVRRFVTDKFSDRYLATIGAKTSRKTMVFPFPEHKLELRLNLDLWDVMGQGGMPRAYRLYFRGAEAAILVFDLTRPPTLAGLDRFEATLLEVCGRVPGVIACNKADLDRQAQITDAAIAEKERAFAMTSIMTSAKTGANVEEAFRRVGAALCAPLVERFARSQLNPPRQGAQGDGSHWRA